jgi:hypothetical protein
MLMMASAFLAAGLLVGALEGAQRERVLAEHHVGMAERQPVLDLAGLLRQPLREPRRHRGWRVARTAGVGPGVLA